MLKWQILHFSNPQNWFHVKSEWKKFPLCDTLNFKRLSTLSINTNLFSPDISSVRSVSCISSWTPLFWVFREKSFHKWTLDKIVTHIFRGGRKQNDKKKYFILRTVLTSFKVFREIIVLCHNSVEISEIYVNTLTILKQNFHELFRQIGQIFS